MTIKTILLHLNDDSHNNGSTEAALRLTAENKAHVVALYTSARTIIPASYMGYIPPEMIEQSREEQARRAAEAKGLFEESAAAANCSAEVVIEEGYAPDLINNHALAADLVILGRSDPDTESGGQLRHIAEELIISSPRPVLVIPTTIRDMNFGKHILVGWNNSRESSRALHEAMPFLKKAELVTLIQINSTEDSNLETQRILNHLKRHGVNAEFKSGYWPDIDVGDAMLGSLVDYSCDMLVMGAYGRSRIREMILGGATKSVLQHMTAPTLFAH